MNIAILALARATVIDLERLDRYGAQGQQVRPRS